ncbi:MAG: hypothetical protein LBD48_07255 [Treponema sp.]|jgi:hypothetical protein|nr:hypothetical protein [Treponema sp.]
MNVSIALSVLSAACCVFFFFYFRAYIRRHTAAEQLLAEYRAEVYRLIAEIDAATDRDSQLVEERIKTLKKIIEDTDKRLAVYLREQERRRQGEALYTSLGRGIQAALHTAPLPAPAPEAAPLPPPEVPVPAAAETPAKAGAQRGRKPARTGRGKKRGGEQPILDFPEQPAAKSLKIQIAELAAQGLSPEQTASRLGISLSEVDLALSLLRR